MSLLAAVVPGVSEDLSISGVLQRLLVTLSVAFFLSLILTRLIRGLGHRLGWMDRPDGFRKVHAVPVPRLGGIALGASIGLAYLLLLALPPTSWLDLEARHALVRLAIASTCVLGVGLLDDVFGVSPLAKLAVQSAAGLYLYDNGYQINLLSNPLGGGAFSLGAFALPVTLLWFVGMSNAFNLIDGLDGLAAGVAVFSSSIFLVVALLNGRWEIVFLAAAMVGGLLGFLRYNFHPATIFLGDSGSLFLGFLLAALAVRGSVKGSAAVAALAPFLALGLPILDTVTTVFRRLLSGRSILEGDADHIHHRMVRQGLTPQAAVIILYGVTAIFGAMSLLTILGRGQVISLAAIVFTLLTWFAIRQLGFSELERLPLLLRRGLSVELRQTVRARAETHLPVLEGELLLSHSLPEISAALNRAAPILGLRTLELTVFTVPQGPPPTAAGTIGLSWSDESAAVGHDATFSWRIPLAIGAIPVGELAVSGPLVEGAIRAGDLQRVVAVLALSLDRAMSLAGQAGGPGSSPTPVRH